MSDDASTHELQAHGQPPVGRDVHIVGLRRERRREGGKEGG